MAEKGVGHGGLARAGFADETEDLPRLDLERDVGDDVRPGRLQVDPKPLYDESCVRRARRRAARRARRRSRRRAARQARRRSRRRAA